MQRVSPALHDFIPFSHLCNNLQVQLWRPESTSAMAGRYEAMLRAEKLAVAGRLAATVAHEINNPLEVIANMLYLISLSETAEEARRLAVSALDELMRISLIAQSALKFHRPRGECEDPDPPVADVFLESGKA